MARMISDTLPGKIRLIQADGSEQQWERVRYVMTVDPKELLVYAVVKGEPTLIHRVGYVEFKKVKAGRTLKVTDDQGATWYLTKSGGCGCGSPLRRATIAKDIAG